MDTEILSSYLKEIGKRTGLRLELDEDGLCGLECENGLTCGIVLIEESRIGFFSPMLELGDRNKAALFEYLLGRNLFSLEPVGAALGYDEDREEVIFCLPLATETLTADSFAEKLGLFITAAGRLKAEIGEYVQDSGDTTAAPKMDGLWQFVRA
ncbi:putative Type III secretion system chaperone [Gammaproteobacteria bacterium]